jgi:non-ribosomal peptide synthetase-like protein
MSTVVDTDRRLGREARRNGPSCLHDLFERTAAEVPERVAVSCRGTETTYHELDLAANRLAARLRAEGVGRGDYVGILLPRSTGVYVAMLAVLKTGAAYVPLDPDYPADRIAYILGDCQARALISTASLAARREGFESLIVELDGNTPSLETESIEVREAHPDDVCYVIYTSGTTGRPKGVQIEHRSACHLVEAESELFAVEPNDRVYQGFSVAFDASVEEIWLAFQSGATLVVGTREMVESGPALGRLLTEAGVTVFSTVPTLLAMLEDDLPTVRLLILGGEACPADLVARWATPGRRLVNTYGPTEATVIATFAECLPGRPVTIGQPVPGYSIHLLDEQSRPSARGDSGEICIGGPGLARGYVGLPELTRAKFIDNPCLGPDDPSPRLYRTGDLGRFNAEGDLEFLGRLDSQVKLRGFRIELSEIESVLRGVPDVLACAVALRVDDPGLPRLVAYVVPRPGATLSWIEIAGTLRARLPAYMIPSHVELISAIPTLPSGKVDRGALPAPQLTTGGLDAVVEESGARTERETALCRAWAELFAPIPVTIHDDFFRDLGGHSLLAARMVSRLRTTPGFAGFSVLDVYENPTISALAAKLDAAHVADVEPTIAPPRPLRLSQRAYLLCGLAQGFGLYFILGFFSLQWLAPYLAYTYLIDEDETRLTAILGALATLVAIYPLMMALSIVVKWAVVGRFKAGDYPLWGGQFLRWWFVKMFSAVVPVGYLEGTPLLSWYYRMMGAKIGANVHLATAGLVAYDLATIGDDSSIGYDTSFPGYAIEDGLLKLAPFEIGRGCFIGNRAVVREGTVIKDGAALEDLSLLPRGGRIPRGERWAGSPARKVGTGETTTMPRASFARRFGFGLLHMVGTIVFPVMMVLAILPGVVVMNELNYRDESYWYLLVSPLVAASFVILLCLEIAVVKWLLLGRVKAGKYRIDSGFYVRKWFVDQLMSLSLDLVGPLYATLYLNPWYRLLGARLGKQAEVSTASFLSPDLLDLDNEVFVADAVSLGAPRIEGGMVTVGPIRAGRRSFIGNSALVAPGTVLGENVLIGCLSTTPDAIPGATADGSAWLGSPAVYLPQRQESTTFDEARTFNPPRRLLARRAAIELCRIVLPPTVFLALTCVLLSVILVIRDEVSLLALIALFPLLYTAFGVAAAFIAIAFKWILMGRYRPCEHPLWSGYVWVNELVTSMHDNLARLFFIDMLEGTPFLNCYYRLLGAKIGRRVYLGMNNLTEFDLIEVGDNATIDEEATLQPHLFEDRVLKMSHVRIGPGCSVGSQAVVLYDTQMEEGSSLNALSLIMKGETLPAATSWEGSPARPCP